MKTLIAFAMFAGLTMAQKLPQAQPSNVEKPMVAMDGDADSACFFLSTHKVGGEYKKKLKIECEAELAEEKRRIRDANAPATLQNTNEEDAIGLPVVNSANKTLTYREEKTPNGFAMDASKDWAKHTEKMANIDKDKTVGVAKANNPSACTKTRAILGDGCFGVQSNVGIFPGYYGAYPSYYGSGYVVGAQVAVVGQQQQLFDPMQKGVNTISFPAPMPQYAVGMQQGGNVVYNTAPPQQQRRR